MVRSLDIFPLLLGGLRIYAVVSELQYFLSLSWKYVDNAIARALHRDHLSQCSAG